MRLTTSRRAIAVSLFLIPLVCSLILSTNLKEEAVAQNYYEPVGGVIIPTNNMLGPWIGVIALIAVIVAAAFWRGKNTLNM